MNEQQNLDEVHLIKLKLNSKTANPVRIECPYLKNFSPKVQLKTKYPMYVPLIQRLYISNDHPSASNKINVIPIEIKTLLQHPFDKHNLKIQTYEDQKRTKKAQLLNVSLQFALALTIKDQTNYIDVHFKFAHLKKDILVFGKMNPYILITNDQWKFKSQQIKQGHLSPQFYQTINIPFGSVFDQITIQLRHQGERIGYQKMYIFEFFGKEQDRQIQIKKEYKMVGTLTYSALDFEPQDF